MKLSKRTLFFPLSLSLLCFSSVFAEKKESSAKSHSMFPEKLLNKEGKEVDASVLDNKIIGIYFSAQWCPPCRHFTPTLVDFRDKNEKDFEVVFVSSDRSPEDQFKYMQKADMKWYTLPHRSDEANALSKKYEIRGIPSLVIIDAEGNTITKNGRGDVSSKPKTAISEWKKQS